MFEPRQVKSNKSRQDPNLTPAHSTGDNASKKAADISTTRVQSHFMVPPEKLDKVTKRVIAPYAQIERKGICIPYNLFHPKIKL